MEYTILTVNQQAAILRGCMESAEADHFRATVQRNAALTLANGTGNVDMFDQQLAAAEASWDTAKAALDALPHTDAAPVAVGVPDAPEAASTVAATEAPPSNMEPTEGAQH